MNSASAAALLPNVNAASPSCIDPDPACVRALVDALNRRIGLRTRIELPRTAILRRLRLSKVIAAVGSLPIVHGGLRVCTDGLRAPRHDAVPTPGIRWGTSGTISSKALSACRYFLSVRRPTASSYLLPIAPTRVLYAFSVSP